MFPLKISTDNAFEDQADNDMKLNAGFMLIGPVLKKSECETHFENVILYFRIHPSMRNMGLARKAFLKCKKHKTLKSYDVSLVDNLPSSPIIEAIKAAWQRDAYREVHYMDKENINHCRWFSQLLAEVEVEEDKMNTN